MTRRAADDFVAIRAAMKPDGAGQSVSFADMALENKQQILKFIEPISPKAAATAAAVVATLDSGEPPLTTSEWDKREQIMVLSASQVDPKHIATRFNISEEELRSLYVVELHYGPLIVRAGILKSLFAAMRNGETRAAAVLIEWMHRHKKEIQEA